MRIALTILLSAIVLSPLTAYGIDVWGDQWGTWTRDNSPYNVVGEIRVPPESTLIIEPGVVVDFQGYYALLVDSLATLLAVGTEADSIYFTPEDTATGWHGIRFLHADSNSQISYCWFEHGKAAGDVHEDRSGGAIYCYYSSPTISNSSFTHNCAASYGGGIYCYSSAPTISDNHISDNSAFYRGGGIHCSQSNPIVSDNTINGNYADEEGGGICCRDHSSPTITGNTIAGNSSLYIGAGISSTLDSNPTIERNTISENSTEGGGGGICCLNAGAAIRDNAVVGNSAWGGGGIFCDHSDASIDNNIITSNRATGDDGGGGIFCYYSSPTITGNLISENSAYDYWSEYASGGGIYCGDSNPTVTSNTISGNSARFAGGAVFCYSYSDATISANTISGNSADSFGGGIACYYYSNPWITNTILWADAAPEGSEIYVENSNPAVRYCDVQGGWPGTGNINADPLFAGPYNEDFHLRWHSPCIDAGVPDSLDPDGTRSDIGAFYFNQDVAGIIEVYPHERPIIVPPWGRCIFYDAWVFNFSNNTLTVDVRSYFCSPETGRSRWLDKHNNVSIAVGDSVGRVSIRHRFPDYAPPGDYTFVAYIGDFPHNIVDSCYFYLTKVDTICGGLRDCLEPEDFFKETSTTENSLPNDYALCQNYPNPFNVQTVLSYQLPVESHVRLEVYNTLGQKVATLVHSKQQAGYRFAIWDASELSSGLYFYKLTAGDFTETRRMALVK